MSFLEAEKLFYLWLRGQNWGENWLEIGVKKCHEINEAQMSFLQVKKVIYLMPKGPNWGEEGG